MSHFTVMVIGDNPEEQLEPYDENLEVDERVVGDVSYKDKSNFVDVYTKFVSGRNYGPTNENEAIKNSKLTFDELYSKYGTDWNGDIWRKNENNVWVEYSTYNPDSKWDWYQLGGRWNDFLKLKKGKKGIKGSPSLLDDQPSNKNDYCDRALKKDIDFDGMRSKAEEDARKNYEKVLSVFGGCIPKVDHSWKTIINDNNPYFNSMTIDEKREFFHNQPALIKVKEHEKELGYDFDIENYQYTLDEYIQKARNESISTFAVVKNGVWYEKGHMGWWACVSNENDKWNTEFNKLLDETLDDELISIYDCHI